MILIILFDLLTPNNGTPFSHSTFLNITNFTPTLFQTHLNINTLANITPLYPLLRNFFYTTLTPMNYYLLLKLRSPQHALSFLTRTRLNTKKKTTRYPSYRYLLTPPTKRVRLSPRRWSHLTPLYHRLFPAITTTSFQASSLHPCGKLLTLNDFHRFTHSKVYRFTPPTKTSIRRRFFWKLRFSQPAYRFSRTLRYLRNYIEKQEFINDRTLSFTKSYLTVKIRRLRLVTKFFKKQLARYEWKGTSRINSYTYLNRNPFTFKHDKLPTPLIFDTNPEIFPILLFRFYRKRLKTNSPVRQFNLSNVLEKGRVRRATLFNFFQKTIITRRLKRLRRSISSTRTKFSKKKPFGVHTKTNRRLFTRTSRRFLLKPVGNRTRVSKKSHRKSLNPYIGKILITQIRRKLLEKSITIKEFRTFIKVFRTSIKKFRLKTNRNDFFISVDMKLNRYWRNFSLLRTRRRSNQISWCYKPRLRHWLNRSLNRTVGSKNFSDQLWQYFNTKLTTSLDQRTGKRLARLFTQILFMNTQPLLTTRITKLTIRRFGRTIRRQLKWLRRASPLTSLRFVMSKFPISKTRRVLLLTEGRLAYRFTHRNWVKTINPSKYKRRRLGVTNQTRKNFLHMKVRPRAAQVQQVISVLRFTELVNRIIPKVTYITRFKEGVDKPNSPQWTTITSFYKPRLTDTFLPRFRLRVNTKTLTLNLNKVSKGLTQNKTQLHDLLIYKFCETSNRSVLTTTNTLSLDQHPRIESRYKLPFTFPMHGFLYVYNPTNRPALPTIIGSNKRAQPYNFFKLQRAKETKLQLLRGVIPTLEQMFYKPSLTNYTPNILDYKHLILNRPLQTPVLQGRHLHSSYSSVRQDPYFETVNHHSIKAPGDYNWQMIRLPRVRFKPGYSRIWRRVRNELKTGLDVHFQYQYRFTRYLLRFYRKPTTQLSRWQTLTLSNVLIQSLFLPDIFTTDLFINNKLVYVNGQNMINSSYTLLPGDHLQLVVHLHFYITYKWLVHWTIARRLKWKQTLKRVDKHRRVSHLKQKNYTIPIWVLQVRRFETDIPKFLEVDYFTLSTVVLYEPFQLIDFVTHEEATLPYPIFNMYNWKYIT